MLVRLADAWTAARDDPDIRVAVVTGAGDKAFSFGILILDGSFR